MKYITTNNQNACLYTHTFNLQVEFDLKQARYSPK